MLLEAGPRPGTTPWRMQLQTRRGAGADFCLDEAVYTDRVWALARGGGERLSADRIRQAERLA